MMNAGFLLLTIWCICSNICTVITIAGQQCDGQMDGVRLPCPTNCSSFIICENNNDVLMDCPTPLKFNPENQNCDYPYNVKPPEGYCVYPDEYYYDKHFCDCNKFIVCDRGTPVEFDCRQHYESDVCRNDCE
ncbi:peritrophin-1-like [Diorhabda carinulata]|uniref:peritrophin-1-like n=1 Tax=Diorhabda carinulata TaxID=1163345 RepID=UPI0025A2D115|nr:peritrophin-1-like [Diorhabda carinulata]